MVQFNVNHQAVGVGRNVPPMAPAQAHPAVRPAVAPAVAAAGNLPGLPAAIAAISLRQPANTGLLGKIKAKIVRIKDFTTSFRHPSLLPQKFPETISVTVNGQAVNIPKEQYKPMLKGLKDATKMTALANLPQILGQRIQHGLTLLQNVRDGNTPPPPSTQDVADLTLALYALADQQGDAFSNGSFSVEDPHGRLAQWLDTSNDVYIRSSSHLKAYQKALVDGHTNKQRGIDIPEGVMTGLPNGHRTMLFGTIPERQAADGTVVPRRLFLKTESAGCRISTAYLPLPKLIKGIESSKSANMNIRRVKLSDIPSSIRHGLSFIKSRGKQGVDTARKEHFPEAVTDKYKTLKKVLENYPNDKDKVLAYLNEGQPDKGGGVCLLRDNIVRLKQDYNSGRVQFNPADGRKIIDLVESFEKFINGTMPQEYAPERNARLGNEVLINFTSAPPVPPAPQPPTVN